MQTHQLIFSASGMAKRLVAGIARSPLRHIPDLALVFTGQRRV
jgi:hypothetical protein